MLSIPPRRAKNIPEFWLVKIRRTSPPVVVGSVGVLLGGKGEVSRTSEPCECSSQEMRSWGAVGVLHATGAGDHYSCHASLWGVGRGSLRFSPVLRCSLVLHREGHLMVTPLDSDALVWS